MQAAGNSTGEPSLGAETSREEDDGDEAARVLQSGNLTDDPSLGAEASMVKAVYCVCQVSPGVLQCGGMFYSLMQCDPNCPRLCHSKGWRWKACDGVRMITWFQRLHYKWTTCPDDPLAR